jgi:hypothetical protein
VTQGHLQRELPEGEEAQIEVHADTLLVQRALEEEALAASLGGGGAAEAAGGPAATADAVVEQLVLVRGMGGSGGGAVRRGKEVPLLLKWRAVDEAEEALERLRAGERELAISSYCGTNLVVDAIGSTPLCCCCCSARVLLHLPDVLTFACAHTLFTNVGALLCRQCAPPAPRPARRLPPPHRRRRTPHQKRTAGRRRR